MLLDFIGRTVLFDVACDIKFFFYYIFVYIFFYTLFFIDKEAVLPVDELVVVFVVVGTNFALILLTEDFSYVYFIKGFFYTSVFFVSTFAGFGKLEFKGTFFTELGFII